MRELGLQTTPEEIAQTLLLGSLELYGAPSGLILLHRERRALSSRLGKSCWEDVSATGIEAFFRTTIGEVSNTRGDSIRFPHDLKGANSRSWEMRVREQDVATLLLRVGDDAHPVKNEAVAALAGHAARLLAAAQAGYDRLELRRLRETFEAELQDMEAFVADAQSISRTGSWMWNPTNPEIGEWSAETYKMLGYDPSQTQASFENNFARVHPEDKERYLAEVTAAADNEKDLDVQYRYLLPDGTIRHVHARGRRLSPTLYIGTANDITQRRAAEAAIRDAQIELASASRLSTLGELVTSISHELNQPLAAVVANAGAAKRWLVRDPPDLDTARESIETLVEDAKRAQAVIDSLRALARRSEPERRALDLNQAVIEIAPLAKSELRSRNNSLELCLDRGTPFLFADRVQVQQVILTLLMTCLDHVDNSVECDRVLTLRTSRSDDEVIISVDGPCQIDRHFLERHVSPEDLIGQRLAIIVCRSIVEAHGGRIRLSDGMMQDSLLEVTFPSLEVSLQLRENRS
ncbi:multi-sensor signal transduction histidine kinase [Sinorhizobium meliloti CCNWSX0020]|uniref:histidine kinase n=2 Tax=Rhizobium meliloti TaxID=382 RepID=H0G2D8_RHIML|nr:multi-sensor signal transduction histidine kinase [Sinorhizobium meliloti CCNWSX0020]